ncbi:MAG: gas vesicle protein GvpG [Chloroflexi bacterium]|nr:gas vesicle protein GvpG [Chloroflexota bacterium]
MGLVMGLLTLPVLGPPRLAHWLASTLAQEALAQVLDEGSLRAELMALQERLDAGELTAEEYDRQEQALLERLSVIRKFKAEQGSQGWGAR